MRGGRCIRGDGRYTLDDADIPGLFSVARNFAAEIIGNVLSLEPRKWRRPRKMDSSLNKHRARELGTSFQPYDWTLQLAEGKE